MKFAIPECNYDALEKKMVRVQNKCRKYGCDFKFEVIGEEFKAVVEDGEETGVVERYILIEAEGVAIINNWQFVAELQHLNGGNIIEKAVDIEVPERYYTTTPICEHCKSSRTRKNTYIVRNTETGEFKQVGRTCLKDFTFGMSAEAVASYATLIHEIDEAQHSCGGWQSSFYYETEEYLQYVVETVNKFGYVPAGSEDNTPTKAMVSDIIRAKHHRMSRDERDYETQLLAKLDSIGYQHDRPENVETVKKALEWALAQEETNNYMHNLRTICKQDCVKPQFTGILASLIPVYYKAVDRELKLAEQRKQDADSTWQGKIGDKMSVKVVDWRCVTSWASQFGYVYIYRMVDENGNIFTWKTSKSISEKLATFTITGKVKAHNEFRQAKQTELTRCKIA